MSDVVVIKDPKQVAELEYGTQYVLDVGFDEPDHDAEAFADAYLKARDAAPEPERPPVVTVGFEKRKALFTADGDVTVKVGGDVRDGSLVLRAGKTRTKPLTREGSGVVTVDDVPHQIPKDVL